MQDAINAKIEAAAQTKARIGANQAAVVGKLFYSARKFNLGFHFRDGAKVGDIINNEDGSRFEVLAVV